MAGAGTDTTDVTVTVDIGDHNVSVELSYDGVNPEPLIVGYYDGLRLPSSAVTVSTDLLVDGMEPEPEVIDLDQVVAALKRHRVKAIVEMTGGGVATLFAGPTHEEPGYGTRFAAACGPGYFAGPNYTLPRVVVGDIFVGPDDDGGAPVTEPTTIDELVEAIVTQVNEGSPRG